MSLSTVVHHEHNHGPHWTADGSKKWVREETDGTVLRVSAKAMNITWGGDERFWRWIEIDESKVATELVQVSWMEVKGTVDISKHKKLLPCQQYEVVYVIKFKDDAFCWNEAPVMFHLTTPDGKCMKSSPRTLVPSSGGGEWKDVHGEEFMTPEHVHGKLHFGMAEVECDIWKGGMILDGAIIRPKSTT